MSTSGEVGGGDVGFVSLDRVGTRGVRWLWPGWIPGDKITVLDGDPG